MKIRDEERVTIPFQFFGDNPFIFEMSKSNLLTIKFKFIPLQVDEKENFPWLFLLLFKNLLCVRYLTNLIK